MQLKWFIGLIIMVTAGGVAAQCKQPVPPELEIDGTQDRRVDMMSAKQVLQTYLTQADRYLDCLDRMGTIAMTSGKDTEASRDQRIAAYSRVMAEMNAEVDAFRQQAELFNGR